MDKTTIGLTSKQALINKEMGTNQISDNPRRIITSLKLVIFSSYGLLYMSMIFTSLIFYLVTFDLKYLFLLIICTLVSSINLYRLFNYFWSAEKEKLKDLQDPVKVYRDGKLIELCSSEIVYADCVSLTVGDVIPADGFLIEGTLKLKVDESHITTATVFEKVDIEDCFTPEGRNTSCFRGNTVISGSAIMYVTAVGDGTKLAKELL